MPPSRLSPGGGTRAGTDLADALRDAAEAGIQYYSRLGRLAVDLAEALLPAAARLQPSARPHERPSAAGPGRAQAAGETARTIVVEAEAGKRGLGVFMVENTSGETVSGPLTVSGFTGPSGKKVRPTVTFSPDLVTLDPGDQVLVQVAALVDEALEPDVRYRAEISVPTLSGTRIPLVIRRHAGAERRGKRQQAAAKKAPVAKKDTAPKKSPAAGPPAKRGRAARPRPGA